MNSTYKWNEELKAAPRQALCVSKIQQKVFRYRREAFGWVEVAGTSDALDKIDSRASVPEGNWVALIARERLGDSNYKARRFQRFSRSTRHEHGRL